MIATVINKKKFCITITVPKAVINNQISLKDLMISKNNSMFNDYNTSQMIWESRIRYLKEYKVVLENMLAKLDMEKHLPTGIKGISRVSPELYNEVNLSLNLVKQILTFNDCLIQGTLKDLLNVYPIENTFLTYITTDSLKLLFFNIKELELWYFDNGVPLYMDEKLLIKEFQIYRRSRKTAGQKNLYHDLFELIISYCYFEHK